MSNKNVKSKSYCGIIKFRPSTDSIKESSFVSDGTYNGYVSYLSENGRATVNWIEQDTTEEVSLEHLEAVRPYFQHETVHGEIMKESYPMLFYVMDNEQQVITRSVDFKNKCNPGDKCKVIDYKLLYNKPLINPDYEYTIETIKDSGIDLKQQLNGNTILTFGDIKRNQFKLTSKQDTYTLYEVVCPMCNSIYNN